MPASLIASGKEALKRFDFISSERIDLNAFPRPQRTIEFLNGESEYSIRDKKLNPVNNPLQLVRPYALHSCSSLYYEINPGMSGPNIYRTERGWGEDGRKEEGYLKLVKAFETFSVKLLESLNVEDAETRRAQVKTALDEEFGGKKVSQYLTPEDARKISPDQSPESWLVYGMLNVLLHPSPEVSARARLRSLELLSLFTPQAMTDGFRSEKQRYHNGYDRISPPRLPERIATREERLATDKVEWTRNPFMQDLLVRDQNRRLDTRAVTSRLLEESPDLAVSVGLLMLHGADTTEAGLALLQAIPRLDEQTLEKVMGPEASYLTDRFGPAGATGQVVQGLGLASSRPTATAAELQQQLLRKESYANHLKEELSRTQVQLAAAQTSLQESQARVQSLENWSVRAQKFMQENEQRTTALVETVLELSGQPARQRLEGLETLLSGGRLSELELPLVVRSRDQALAQAAREASDLGALGQVAATASNCLQPTALELVDRALSMVVGPLGGPLGNLREEVASGATPPGEALRTLKEVGEDYARLSATREGMAGVRVGDGHVQVGAVRVQQRR
ncbi:MAG: hypothetical protein AMXMBFR33_47210 [Candidatus Xenobia bacterium]